MICTRSESLASVRSCSSRDGGRRRQRPITHEEDAREEQGSREDDCKEEQPRFAGLDAADGGDDRVQRRRNVSEMRRAR